LGAARDPGIGTAAPTATQPMARARPPIDCESESYGRYYQDAHGQLRTLSSSLRPSRLCRQWVNARRAREAYH